MNIEEVRNFCLKLNGTEEDYPFGEDTLVFKVGGKIFALASLDSIPLQINLKCDPEKAIELRETYDSVIPGYHMNKKHWNTVVLDGSVRNREVQDWIKDSYYLVFNSLKKSEKEKLNK
jgi:predicted DNA-binding protein (MmcQ/YjbR family)